MYGRKREEELKQKRITVQVSIKEIEIIEELFNGDYRWIGVRAL